MRVAYNLAMQAPAGVIMEPVPPDPVIFTQQGPIPFSQLSMIWKYPVTWNLPGEDKPA